MKISLGLKAIGPLMLCIPFASCGHFGKVFAGNHIPYRMNTGTANAPDSTIAILDPPPGSTKRATIGYLEFDDQGELWRNPPPGEPNNEKGWKEGSSTQLPTVLKAIREKTSKGPIRTIVFIHGWKNNPSPRDEHDGGNLYHFKRSLQELASASDYPVFGVYIGWRGTATGWRKEPGASLDVFSREAAAERIGRSSMAASLRAVSAATHRNPRSSVLAVGHSYGGKILTAVTSDSLAMQLGNSIGASDRDKVDLKPFADTIVVVNTAENSSVPLQMVNLMRDYKVNYKSSSNQRNLPVVVSISSPEDTAIRLGIPWFNRLTRNWIGLPNRGGATASSLQDHSLFNAMGFFGPLRSHVLNQKDGKPATGSRPVFDDKQSWQPLILENVRLGSSAPNGKILTGTVLEVALAKEGNTTDLKTFGHYKVDVFHPADDDPFQYGAAYNDTPWWFLQVPDFVCMGHNDIWNPNFVSLLSAIEAMSRPPSDAVPVKPQERPQMKTQEAPN